MMDVKMLTRKRSAADAQALHDQLAAQGVSIVSAPSDGPFGRTFAVSDPDGYVTTIDDGV